MFLNYINEDILKDYKLIRTNSLKSFFSSLWYLPRNLKRKKSFKSFSDKYLDTNKKVYLTLNIVFISSKFVISIFNPLLFKVSTS